MSEQKDYGMDILGDDYEPNAPPRLKAWLRYRRHFPEFFRDLVGLKKKIDPEITRPGQGIAPPQQTSAELRAEREENFRVELLSGIGASVLPPEAKIAQEELPDE